jgi:TRAP-type C4-dicarboxylate transport system permease large subunit
MYIVETYAAYLLISIALTVWVARTLHKNGRVFLIDSFGGRETLADSVNQLLVVGFYLINIGFVSFALKESRRPQDVAETIEALSTKIGLVLLVLGFMHFFNILVFSRMRKRDTQRHIPPPPLPQERWVPADSRTPVEPREKARS